MASNTGRQKVRQKILQKVSVIKTNFFDNVRKIVHFGILIRILSWKQKQKTQVFVMITENFWRIFWRTFWRHYLTPYKTPAFVSNWLLWTLPSHSQLHSTIFLFPSDSWAAYLSGILTLAKNTKLQHTHSVILHL